MFHRRAIGMPAPVISLCTTLACGGAQPTQPPSKNALASATISRVQELVGPPTTPLPTSTDIPTSPPAIRLPTDAPEPTNTPASTDTPADTATSRLTDTARPPTNTPTPRPTRPPTQPPVPTQPPIRAGNCDPSYPTVCIPPRPPDPHGFDRDHDGSGCESG